MARQGLVIRFSSLGDIILTSAPLLNLKIRYPDHHIIFLTKQRFEPVVRMMSGVDEVRTIPDDAGVGDLYDVIKQTTDESFGFVADLHGNLRSLAIRKVQTADRIAVYSKRSRERRQIARTHQIPDDYPHTIDLYNQCVKELDGSPHATRPVLQHAATNVVLPFEGDRYAVIAPGAAHANKKWPVERFASVAAQLHKSEGLNIVWAVTAAEKEQSALETAVPPSAFYELVDASLPNLAAVTEHADITIANDSGIAHLSSAVGTPVVAIFGPTHPALGFAPRGRHDRIVSVDEYCRPCSIHGAKPCFREQRFCFTRIEPDDVATVARSIMETTAESSAAVFIDRDGTLIEDRHFLSDPGQIEFIPGAVDALKQVREAGHKIVIVSNQSGVARGHFDITTVETVNKRLLQMLHTEGLEVDGLYYCPHHRDGTVREFARRCNCRKPATGMVEQAATDLNIDLRRSVVIGDKLDDLFLGLAMGGRAMLVRTGYGTEHENKIHGLGNIAGVTVADDLPAAIAHLLK